MGYSLLVLKNENGAREHKLQHVWDQGSLDLRRRHELHLVWDRTGPCPGHSVSHDIAASFYLARSHGDLSAELSSQQDLGPQREQPAELDSQRQLGLSESSQPSKSHDFTESLTACEDRQCWFNPAPTLPATRTGENHQVNIKTAGKYCRTFRAPPLTGSYCSSL